MVAGGVVVAGDVEGGAAGGGGCGAVCFEPDGIETKERYVYKGAGLGSYKEVQNWEQVGLGKGDYEKEKVVTSSGSRLRFVCIGFICFAFLLVLGILFFWLYEPSVPGRADECEVQASSSTVISDPAFKATCCSRGFEIFCEHAPPVPTDKVVIHDKYYTHVKDVHVPHMVPVPIPPPPRQVITHKVLVHTPAYDCQEGLNDWKSQWTPSHQRYCCYKQQVACSTKVTYRPHYHTITHVKHVTVPVPEPIPAPPARVINHVVNVPVHDPPQVIQVPVPGHPHVVPKYIHEKHYVPVPEPSPPKYHNVPVPVPVKEPGKVIKVPVPLPSQTVVKNKVIYRTKHVKVKHIYDCHAGFENWKYGWSSAKQTWCCSHESKGCPGSWKGDGLTKTVVTHVTQHMGDAGYEHVYHHYQDDSPSVIHVHHYHVVHGDGDFDPDEVDAGDLDGGSFEDGGSLDGDVDGGSFDGDGASFGGSGSFHHSSFHSSGGGAFHSSGFSHHFSSSDISDSIDDMKKKQK